MQTLKQLMPPPLKSLLWGGTNESTPFTNIGSSLLLTKKTMMARSKEWLPAYDYKEFARLTRTNDLESLVGRGRLLG